MAWLPENRNQYAAISQIFTMLADWVMAPYAQSPGPGASVKAKTAEELNRSAANAATAADIEAKKKEDKKFTTKLSKALAPVSQVANVAGTVAGVASGNPLAMMLKTKPEPLPINQPYEEYLD